MYIDNGSASLVDGMYIENSEDVEDLFMGAKLGEDSCCDEVSLRAVVLFG